MTKITTGTDPVYRRLVAMKAVDDQSAIKDSKIDDIIPNGLKVAQPTVLDAIILTS